MQPAGLTLAVADKRGRPIGHLGAQVLAAAMRGTWRCCGRRESTTNGIGVPRTLVFSASRASSSPPSPTPLPRLTLRLVGESQPASARATSLPTRADRDCDQSRCRSIAARVKESRARACARGPGAESALRQAWGVGDGGRCRGRELARPVRGEAPGGLRRSRGSRRLFRPACSSCRGSHVSASADELSAQT
jgi:hypothetical protein